MRKAKSITISLGKGDKEKLESLCKKKGLLWGNNPSISRLLRNIANKNLVVSASDTLTEEQSEAIKLAIPLLVEKDNIDSASILIALLIEKSSEPFFSDKNLLSLVGSDFRLCKWKKLISFYIAHFKSFLLFYEENEEILIFDVCFAKIRFEDKKELLQTKCREISNNFFFLRKFDFAKVRNVLDSNSLWQPE